MGPNQTVVLNLQNFLGLDTQFVEPDVKVDSVTKWRSTIDDQDIANIRRITGIDVAS